MRKFYLVAVAVAAFVLTGCLDSNNDTYDRIIRIQPGVEIYNLATVQNNVSIDGASVAMRLGILLAESELQEEPDLTQLKAKIGDTDYGNLFDRLFGNATKVEPSETDPTVYLITYNETAGSTDIYKRKGVFRIETNGVALEDITETPWKVSIESATMVYSSSALGTTITAVAGNTLTLGKSGSSTFTIRFDNSICRAGTAEYTSSWSGNFVFSTMVYSGTTSATGATGFEWFNGNSFAFSGLASGTTCFTLNGTSGAAMSYATATNNPLIYKPAKAIFFPVGGSEVVSLTRTSDYDATYFVSPTVTYEWVLNGSTLNYTIGYNGYSETF